MSSHHHLSLNCEGCWGTTDDFTTSFVHFSLFSTALWDLPNSRPVQLQCTNHKIMKCSNVKWSKIWNHFVLDGDVAQLVQHGTGTPLRLVWFPGAARDFSPRVKLQCRLSYCVCTPPCAITYINICVHVKDPVVHVRVWWIMETLQHPACTVGWVVWLSQLAFPREGSLNFPWENAYWDNSCKK